MKPLIKICGINDFNVLQQLVSIDNINYLGFIFYEKSVRNVSPEFLEQVKNLNLKIRDQFVYMLILIKITSKKLLHILKILSFNFMEMKQVTSVILLIMNFGKY